MADADLRPWRHYLLHLFYGAMEIISGAIGAAIYNLFAGIVGGISVDVE